MFGAKPAGFTETAMLLPDAVTLSHAALEATEWESEPPPPLLTVTFCAPEAGPPTKTEKFKLEVESEIAGGCWTRPAIKFIESEPLAAATTMVTIPNPKLAGKLAVIMPSLHEST